MKVQRIDGSNYNTFGHTSSDHYIRMGRYTEPIENIHKQFMRWGDPWYRKMLYPFEDLRDCIVKLIKKR
ncbi:hypothetical protein IKQ21_02100 [bacterium]|nr:hypothetical protein [bacterium]